MAASTLSALGGGPPKYDLVGPTVDDDFRRLIARYGMAAVKDATARLTKAKRGRKALRDWADLMPWIEDDAKAWLEGRDPFAERSPYAIAKAYADGIGGVYHASIMQRAERKLRQKQYGRSWYVFVRAMEMSLDGYPYAAHICALEALSQHDARPVWQKALARFRADIADYVAKWGAPPDELTVKQIEEGARKPLSSTTTLSGLLGRTLEGYSPSATILAQAIDRDVTT